MLEIYLILFHSTQGSLCFRRPPAPSHDLPGREQLPTKESVDTETLETLDTCINPWRVLLQEKKKCWPFTYKEKMTKIQHDGVSFSLLWTCSGRCLLHPTPPEQSLILRKMSQRSKRPGPTSRLMISHLQHCTTMKNKRFYSYLLIK